MVPDLNERQRAAVRYIDGPLLVLAGAGLATMWMAVAADVGASLLVIGNGLRLLKPLN